MQDIKKAMLAAALAVGFFSQGSAHAEPPNSVFHYKDLSATANFYGSDGCSYTNVYVSGYADAIGTAGGGRPTHSTVVYVDYYINNYCDGTYAYGYGSTTDGTVTGQDLQSAEVRATVPVYEYSSTSGSSTGTAGVNLVFTANGNYVSRGESHYTYTTPFERVRNRQVGQSTSANVSGTVTLDGTNLLAGTTSQDASISRSNSGTVTIYRNP